MTTFLNCSPSQALGHKEYFRITFDVASQGLIFGAAEEAKLRYIYDHMQESAAFAPLSPNPVSSGDEVMVVDVWTLPAGEGLSIAEGVRRLETVAGDYAGAGSSVRQVQKLSGIGAITGGADERDKIASDTNAQNDKDSLTSHLGGFFAGLGNYTTLAVIGLAAYAIILLVPSMTLRRRA